jgi:hypothetical protein
MTTKKHTRNTKQEIHKNAGVPTYLLIELRPASSLDANLGSKGAEECDMGKVPYGGPCASCLKGVPVCRSLGSFGSGFQVVNVVHGK